MTASNRGTAWRGEWTLWLAAIVCAGLLWARLPHLWPLVPGNLWVSEPQMQRQAETVLAGNGIATTGATCRVTRFVNTPLVDWLERRDSAEAAAREITAHDLPALLYDVTFKTAGRPERTSVTLRPDGRLYSLGVYVGFAPGAQADAPGAHLPLSEAISRAQRQISANFQIDVTRGDWRASRQTTIERERRRDFTFAWDRPAPTLPGVRELVSVSLVGDKVASLSRTYVPPPRALGPSARRAALGRSLEAAGNLIVSIGVVGAFLIFLVRLRNQTVRLRRAVVWAGLVFGFLLGGAFLTPALWSEWDTQIALGLWALQYTVDIGRGLVWIALVALCIVAASDAINREAETGRGETLWQFTTGLWQNAGVGWAGLRALPIALIAGGVLAGVTWALETFAGGKVQLSPRGYTLDALNVQCAPLYLSGFFFQIALLEELGYRHFATTYLLQKTRRTYLALAIPAVVYGLTHTTLDFLPPSQPVWGRALALTCVGLVWGVMYLRYDALTVVLAHWCADVFLIGWPRIASGIPSVYMPALLIVLVPLLPSLGLVVRRARSAGKDTDPLAVNGQ